MKQTQVRLDEELESQAKKEQEKNPLAEVKMLLAGDGAKDLHIMRHLAPNSELVKSETELGKRINLEQNNLKYGTTYTINQIEKIARKYHLRFLSVRKFAGKMDVDAISKIKEFSSEYKVACLDESTLTTRFYIMAPEESFMLKTETIWAAREREEEEIRRAKDPVLFYRIDEEHYRLIHKWGNDFTIARRAFGWIWDKPKNLFRVMKIASFLVFLTVLFIGRHWLGTIDWTTAENVKELNKGFCYILIDGLSIGLALLSYFVPKGWVTNSRWEGREVLFGKTNWNSNDRLTWR